MFLVTTKIQDMNQETVSAACIRSPLHAHMALRSLSAGQSSYH